MKLRMPLTLISLALSFAATPLMAQTDHSVIKKELEVMESVFATSLKQEERKHATSITRITSTYLANQGVVFNLSFSGGGRGLVIDLEHLGGLIPPVPPLPPITMVSSEGDIEFEFQREWEEFAEQTTRQVQEALRNSSEKLRELREEERDIAWNERELERELRDLQFQLRNNKDDAELKEELERVEKDMLETKEKKAEAREFAEKLEAEQKQKRAEQEEAQKKLYNQFLADFEAKLGDTLCRFGSGLRALPKGEHVTFVLSNVMSKKSDRIYVFDQKSITQCVQTRIEADQLLTEANVYEF